jgi:glycosyltransferase involved in cell wall biosynthesis
VATVHGLDWQRARWKGAGAKVIRFGERTMVKNIDEVIVVSQDLRGYFEREYGRRTVYIPNGVEPPPSLTAPEEDSRIREFGLSKRDYAICLGRLVPEKRVHDVILAFRHIDFPGKLVIVGDDSSTDPYVSHLRRLAVADPRVVFTGLQRRPSVHALLKNAAFYVSASELEGLPMSLLECMQHGIPAVVTDIPPHRELLDAVTGFESWFPPGDVDALQARMVALLKSYSRYLEVAEQSAELTEREYAWPSIVDRTEAVLYAAAERRVTYHSAQLATERFLQTTGEKRGGER